MLAEFLRQAEADEPVYISDVRGAFQREGKHPFSICVTCYDDSIRSFPLMLPEAENAKENALVSSYVYAMIYNILSVLGAKKITVFTALGDDRCSLLADSLDAVFQSKAARSKRTGYGKCLNVNERVLKAISGKDVRFCFEKAVLDQEPDKALPQSRQEDLPAFASLPQKAADRMLLGIDVGGTDIKLAASVNGKLLSLREYDWYPAEFTRAEQLIDPILQLTAQMRADCCAGGSIRNFDAIGLSFPDVVIRGKIVGGETAKTRGMRQNPDLDYEEEFAKITGLTDLLRAYVTKDGSVRCVNDGPMAAFTAAVEKAAAGEDTTQGFFAHTLGTEPGTGWVRPDGSVPEIPLEVYNCIIDLGSYGRRQYDAGDVRSIRNDNTGLPGTLQKYLSQSGVFRLASERLPQKNPALYGRMLQEGLFVKEKDRLMVPTAPEDHRKACLEFLMRMAGEDETCAGIFRTIGEYLAVIYRETDLLLQPEAKERSLFGRMVKSPRCFDLMREGAARRDPDLHLYTADENLANTDLMRQLQAQSNYTVAQFAQAVGAIYYGCAIL